MSSFTAPLVLVALDEERDGIGEFRTYLPFWYDIGYLGSGNTVVVPAGFDTDLASIPWFARPFISISGRVAKPALLHDYLLSRGDARADDVFEEALGVAGVVGWRARLMVASVRAWSVVRAAKAALSGAKRTAKL